MHVFSTFLSPDQSEHWCLDTGCWGEYLQCAQVSSPGQAHTSVQNPVSLHGAGYSLSPCRGSIHKRGGLWKSFGSTQPESNSSAQRYSPRAHNCGYRDKLRPSKSYTGDKPSLACQHSDRLTHI